MSLNHTLMQRSEFVFLALRVVCMHTSMYLRPVFTVPLLHSARTYRYKLAQSCVDEGHYTYCMESKMVFQTFQQTIQQSSVSYGFKLNDLNHSEHIQNAHLSIGVYCRATVFQKEKNYSLRKNIFFQCWVTPQRYTCVLHRRCKQCTLSDNKVCWVWPAQGEL